VGRAEAGIRTARPVEVAAVRRDADRVEVSREAREGSRVDTVRRDLVDRVRGEIAAGTYDTDERLDLAVEAMVVRTKPDRR
jgi:hypothetical protein